MQFCATNKTAPGNGRDSPKVSLCFRSGTEFRDARGVKPKPPPALPKDVVQRLLEAAARVGAYKPWEFMSDLELIGLREEATGELHVASVLGTLGTMFAVVIYRHDTGLRWIKNIAVTRAIPDSDEGLENLDHLKVEWTVKRELKEPDLAILAIAQFKPSGKGSVWPRFESARPGWYPWHITEAEARLMTEHLHKISRFICLRERAGILHEEPIEAEVPVILAGEETTLAKDELEWVPLEPPAPPAPEPVTLSPQEQESLARLPIRANLVFELIAPLVPELSILDKTLGRPYFGRLGLMVDRESRYALGSQVAHGGRLMSEAVRPTLIKSLGAAGVRPGAIEVENRRMAAALHCACESIGVPVRIRPKLEAARAVLEELKARFARGPDGQQ
jgi:hypothetical protein